MNNKEIFSKNPIRELKKKNLTLVEFARAIKYPDTTVYNNNRDRFVTVKNIIGCLFFASLYCCKVTPRVKK